MRKDFFRSVKKVLTACDNHRQKGIRYTKLKEETGLSDRTTAKILKKLKSEKFLTRGRLIKEGNHIPENGKEYIGTFVYDKTYFLTPDGEFYYYQK